MLIELPAERQEIEKFNGPAIDAQLNPERLGAALLTGENDATLRTMLAEVERRRDHLQAKTVYVRRETQERHGTGIIVGRSPAVRRVLDQVRQVAVTDSTVLLLGASGLEPHPSFIEVSCGATLGRGPGAVERARDDGAGRATRTWGVGHRRLRKTVRATMSTTITAITSSTSLVNVMPAL